MTTSGLGSPHWVIGVDAGGSKTAAALARVDVADDSPRVTVVARGLAGPGNPIAAGWENACNAIRAAVADAFAQAELPPRAVDSVCLAAAGAGTEAIRKQLEDWARQAGISSRVRVVPDGAAVLAAGTSQGLGIAVIAGTGSLAMAQTTAGELLRCGGWGYRLGDEGGSYWLGLEALRSIVQMADGRRPTTPLQNHLLAAWGADDPRPVVEELARGEMESPGQVRKRIAELARTVIRAAQQQDPAAVELVDTAAFQLQRLVAALLARGGAAPGQYELALGGSLLLRSNVLSDRLLARLNEAGQSPLRVGRVSEPEVGAARIAADWPAVGPAYQVEVDRRSP
jgi:N-acetylglucosamine kinase-like BadF-type ATPase